jgi:hypothetical protein
MYRYIDRPVASLDHGGRFLLWAMRMWTQSLGRKQCPTGALAPGFAGMGLLGALPDFHLVLATLNRDALASIVFAPLRACHIAEDEALLLTLWHDAGEPNAEATLKLVVARDQIAPVAAALGRVAGQMAALGLGLAREQAE